MRFIYIVLVSALALFGCDDSGDTDGAGGTAAMGGMPTTGGASAMGGMATMGGQAGMGGQADMGGAPAMGGTPAAGGAPGMGGMPMAGGATGMGGAPMNESDCGHFCRVAFACDLDDMGTEEECVTFCDENPNFFSPRVFGCARDHLAGGTCDEPAFEACAKGPVVRFFEEAAAGVCGRIFECCPSGQQGAFFMTVDDCVGLIAGFGGGFIDGAVNMGYITFDVDAAADCLVQAEAALGAIECAAFPADIGKVFDGTLECEGLIVPLKGEGEDCGLGEANGQGFIPFSDGCTEGLICKADGDEMPTCRPGVATGEACNQDNPECLGDDACIEGVCGLLVAPGEPCMNGAQCTTGNCTEGVCGAPDPLVCNE